KHNSPLPWTRVSVTVNGSPGTPPAAQATVWRFQSGKEIQQVARELRVSIPSVSKWRQRFSLWGLRGLRDRLRPGKPVKYDTAFRNRVLALLEEKPPPGMSHWDGPAVAEKLDASVHAVWRSASRSELSAKAAQLVCEHRQGVCAQSRRRSGVISQPAYQRRGAECG